MMRTVTDIYNHYKIGKHLQLHMLRVAGVVSLICDNIEVSVDKDNLVKAALLHDMGNIIKFQLDLFPEFAQPEGVEYWRGVQKEFIDKYGSSEQQATLQIINEIGVPKEVSALIDEIHFRLLEEHKNTNDFNIKILHYADLITSPFGVVSYEERMKEAHERYKNHKNSVGEEKWVHLNQCGLEMRDQIFSKCKIKPEDINEESVAPIIEELKNFVLK